MSKFVEVTYNEYLDIEGGKFNGKDFTNSLTHVFLTGSVSGGVAGGIGGFISSGPAGGISGAIGGAAIGGISGACSEGASYIVSELFR